MKRRLLPFLALVAMALAGLACEASDAKDVVDVGLDVATIVAPTPTLYGAGPAQISLSNYTLADICEVDFYIAGTNSVPVKVYRWEPGEFQALGLQTVQHAKGTWDIYAFGCDGTLAASQKDVSIYSDLSLVLASE